MRGGAISVEIPGSWQGVCWSHWARMHNRRHMSVAPTTSLQPGIAAPAPTTNSQNAPAKMSPAGWALARSSFLLSTEYYYDSKLVSVIRSLKAIHCTSISTDSARCLISITHTLPGHRCQVQCPHAPQPTFLSSPLSSHLKSRHFTSSLSRTHHSSVLQTSTSSPYSIPRL